MQRTVFNLLVIAMLFTALLLPSAAAFAETAEKIRKKAFAVLVERSKPPSPVRMQRSPTVGGGQLYIGSVLVVNRRKKREILLGTISKINDISCSSVSLSGIEIVFKLKSSEILTKIITVSIPKSYKFDFQGIYPNKNSLIVIKSQINGSAKVRFSKYATFTYIEGQPRDSELLLFAVDEKDGQTRRTKPMYSYVLPISKFTQTAATDLCAESNPVKVLAIARKYKLID